MIYIIFLFISTALIAGSEDQIFRSARDTVTVIARSDFMNPGDSALKKTYVINKPGNYQLASDINFNPTSAAPAVSIQSSNVTLDLNDRSLFYTSTVANSHAILFAPGCDNVTILNGTITGFTGSGIVVQGVANNIVLRDLLVSGSNAPGIFLGALTSGLIKNCLLENVVVNNTNGVGPDSAVGLRLNNCRNIVCNKCSFLDSSSSTFSAYGVWVSNSININFNDCMSGGHQGSNAYGFRVESGCRGVRFKNAVVSNITGTNTACGFCVENSYNTFVKSTIISSVQAATAAYGSYLFSSNSTLYEDCVVSDCGTNIAGTNPSAVTGFYSINGLNNKYVNCSVSGLLGPNITSTTISAWQFAGTESQASLMKCIAQNNGSQSSYAGKVYGFFMNGSSVLYCQVKECQALSNCSTAASSAYGFYDTATSSKNMYVDNFAFGNVSGSSTTNYSVQLATGIFSVIEGDLGGMLNLANKAPYYNVSVVS